MKLNSKLPIFIIGATILAFTSISGINEKLPTINAISGDINEIGDINLKAKTYSESIYLNYEYTMNKDKTTKEASLRTSHDSWQSNDIQLVDVTNDDNLVARIGYETYYEEKESNVHLTIDKYKDEKYKGTIEENSNKYDFTDNEELDTKRLSRTKKENVSPLNVKDRHVKLLGGYMYEGEIYIAAHHHGSDSKTNENIIEISKLNESQDDLELVTSIDLSKETNGYKMMQTDGFHIDEGKIYILISAEKYYTADEETNDVYVTSIDIKNKKHEINKLDKPAKSDIVDSTLKNETINITFKSDHVDEDYGYMEESVLEVTNLDYNVVNNKIDNKFSVSIPNSVVDQENINQVISTEDKIYLLTYDSYNYYYTGYPENDTYIHVIDKNKEELSFSGVVDKELYGEKVYIEKVNDNKGEQYE